MSAHRLWTVPTASWHVNKGIKMRVLFVPHAQGNPYQELLGKAIAKHNVQIQMVSDFQRLPLLSSIRKFGKPEVLHLHWTTPFWLHKQWFLTVLSTLRFSLELLIIKMMGIKIVWTLHDRHWPDNPNPQLEYRLNRLFCLMYDQIIVHCRAAQRVAQETYQLPKFLHKKISVIGHGHFIDYYDTLLSGKGLSDKGQTERGRKKNPP
ncbi:glycosyltransferase [Chloroflexi bacterium TSY]|nr:glycosyltransferase [Chloroflexi bacterium TSY]